MIKVGEIEVEIVPVDHDAYGAAALLIRTPDHFIAYTGDLRLHGYHPERTKEFLSVSQTHGSIDDGRSQYQFS